MAMPTVAGGWLLSAEHVCVVDHHPTPGDIEPDESIIEPVANPSLNPSPSPSPSPNLNPNPNPYFTSLTLTPTPTLTKTVTLSLTWAGSAVGTRDWQGGACTFGGAAVRCIRDDE